MNLHTLTVYQLTIGGEEDGIIGDGELAPIEDAKAMVATGIDFLAAGIGNIHGPYPENWNGLHLDHLQKLTEAVPNFPIVLHGGSGIPDDQIQAAIKLGVAKVNVNTECQIAFAKATRKFVAEYEANEAEYDKKKLFDPRKFLKPGFEAITTYRRIRFSKQSIISLLKQGLFWILFFCTKINSWYLPINL